MNKDFTKEECLKWFKHKNINPRTGNKIKVNAISGFFNKLHKQCNKYKQKPISSIETIYKNIKDFIKKNINNY